LRLVLSKAKQFTQMQKNMENKEYILLPCAGASNVGRLSLAASLEFADDRQGTVWSIAKVACGEEPMKCSASAVIVVVDGCASGCAAKILQSKGITPKAHLLLSDLGIVKEERAEPEADELQLVKDGIEAGCNTTDTSFPRLAGGCCCR
jgi:uncharacterized metal-binding protein